MLPVSLHPMHRDYTPFDRLLMRADSGMRALFCRGPISERPSPAIGIEEAALSKTERDLAGRLMRVNHAGEIAAQGLYRGQALTACQPKVRESMEQAALEENDHLAWCAQRADELGAHVSCLNPLWYCGSMVIGALAGVAGDRWSLGFVNETEQQVVHHLDGHLARIAPHDRRTRAILRKMREDEARHATTAQTAGGATLPVPIRGLMRLTARVMTRTAWWL